MWMPEVKLAQKPCVTQVVLSKIIASARDQEAGQPLPQGEPKQPLLFSGFQLQIQHGLGPAYLVT